MYLPYDRRCAPRHRRSEPTARGGARSRSDLETLIPWTCKAEQRGGKGCCQKNREERPGELAPCGLPSRPRFGFAPRTRFLGPLLVAAHVLMKSEVGDPISRDPAEPIEERAAARDERHADGRAHYRTRHEQAADVRRCSGRQTHDERGERLREKRWSGELQRVAHGDRGQTCDAAGREQCGWQCIVCPRECENESGESPAPEEHGRKAELKQEPDRSRVCRSIRERRPLQRGARNRPSGTCCAEGDCCRHTKRSSDRCSAKRTFERECRSMRSTCHERWYQYHRETGTRETQRSSSARHRHCRRERARERDRLHEIGAPGRQVKPVQRARCGSALNAACKRAANTANAVDPPQTHAAMTANSFGPNERFWSDIPVTVCASPTITPTIATMLTTGNASTAAVSNARTYRPKSCPAMSRMVRRRECAGDECPTIHRHEQQQLER